MCIRDRLGIEEFYRKHSITTPQCQIKRGINPLRGDAPKCKQLAHVIAVVVLQVFNETCANSPRFDASTTVLRGARVHSLDYESLLRKLFLDKTIDENSVGDIDLEIIKAGLDMLQSQELINVYHVVVDPEKIVMHVLA